ncbi:hypothetical protein IIB50_03180 [Patescibacteria group bacterium]|nr:hypothetical protein [Patescibacteria group bacterium]
MMYATLAECKGNLGVAEEMMQPILSEEYSYSDNPQHVWQAAADIVDSRIKCQILVRDSNDLVISWIENLGTMLEDSGKVADIHKLDEMKEFFESEVSEVGEGGTAITTVCVRPRSKGSLMRLRRVYYGRLTQPNMVHSRGIFANFFQGLVTQELGKREVLNADNKALSR